MDFLKKLFGSSVNKEISNTNPLPKGSNIEKVGEINRCPYCQSMLEHIPTRKKKCEFCGKQIYVRTRLIDRKKVLVTDKQKDEIEVQWNLQSKTKEEEQLMNDPEYVQAKKELTKQFGKEPSINDIKWRLFNERIIKFASTKQWGLYRNNKFHMAEQLKEEEKLKEALEIYFEVCYLDLNGCRNVGSYNGKPLSKKEMDEIGIKEFNAEMSFLAPGVVNRIQKLISELNLSENEAENIFCTINEEMKPIKDMPVSSNEAWKKFTYEIQMNKEINLLDMEDYDLLFTEIKEFIKKKNHQRATQIVLNLKSYYYPKKQLIKNPEKLRILVENLLKSNEINISNAAESLLILLVKKDNQIFEALVIDYVNRIQQNFEKYVTSNIIGELEEINLNWVKPLIPHLIRTIKESPEWNSRRFAAFNLGKIGLKDANSIKEAIPIMVDYINNPTEVTKREPLKIKTKEIVITMDLSAEKMLGVDQKEWLKDAYIDSLGMIAKGNSTPIIEYKPLLKRIAETDKSEYSRKKAQKVVDLLT